MPLGNILRRWRENHLVSLVLAGIAKPTWSVSRRLTAQLQAKIMKNGVSIVLPNGQRLQIAKDAGVALASVLFWQGIDGHEPQTSKTLRFFFARSAAFIDVGANCGLYSVLAGLWNPSIKVVAFEPYAPIYTNLKKNVALNQLDARVVCENAALSSRAGTSVFHIPAASGKDYETTGTLASQSWQARKGSPTVEVSTLRFDDYERSNPMRVDLVKIDVEDFEADVIEGMSRTITRDRPFIVCEILPREHRNERTRKIIESLGYTPYWITASGYIRVSRFDFERKDSQDFLLSPVSTSEEIVSDLSALYEKAEALRSASAEPLRPKISIA
jgi:FkbM family methyltransferase